MSDLDGVPNVPKVASAVIIGGGVIGASVAYHLAALGWTEVLVLERGQFGCGTSWHAAGLVGTMRANESHARLCAYSMRVLGELEQETGQSTGFRQVGSLSIAHSAARFQELKRVASMNNAYGVTRVEVVGPEEIERLYPLIDASDLLGGTWVAHDGMASPVDVVMAFVKGARGRGARCLEGVKVTGVNQRHGRVIGVRTEGGDIRTDFVVNCAGMWGRELGLRAGVNVPLQACEHYYAHTEKIEGLPRDLPVLRDHDKCAYYREDAGSLLVGAFEPKARPWGVAGIPEDFCFDELPGHFEEQLMPVLEDAMHRVPLLADVGWRKFFCGPESFTPDNQFHIGEAPELRGYFVGCGLNSVGIQSAGGLGKALAEWMDAGYAPLDLGANDIRRMFPFQGTQRYLTERVSETLGLLYANHYPFRQYESARPARTSPIHERLIEHNACFGEVAGWERPNWFAPPGVEPVYEYSFGKQNWFGFSAEEHRAVRQAVALFDQSSFSKYLVQGRDACAELQRICTVNADVEPGRILYTHWLNERGGVEADLTINRLAENEYLVVSAAASAIRDLDWLARHIHADAHCFVTNVTSAYAVLGLMGPNSRALLTELTGADLSSAAFPYGTCRELDIGYARCRAVRLSFVGELGWEIYLPTEQARHVFDVLVEAGAAHGLRLAGMHALDSGRIEKKFLHFGSDVAVEDTPVEAGVGFVCDMDKPIPFIGHDAIARQHEMPPKKRLVQFLLEDPEVVLYHHEPILWGGQMVGFLSSGNYGHTLGGAVGLGYVKHPDVGMPGWIDSASFAIEVAGVSVRATASLRALYDPSGERARS